MSDDLVKRARWWNFCWPSHDVEMLVPAMADRIEELEAKLTAMSQSREHFKRSAEKQRQRCHNLRHRQRALMAALQNVKDCTSIETAKFVAYIALGGWGDDELVYKARATLAEIKGGKDAESNL